MPLPFYPSPVGNTPYSFDFSDDPNAPITADFTANTGPEFGSYDVEDPVITDGGTVAYIWPTFSSEWGSATAYTIIGTPQSDTFVAGVNDKDLTIDGGSGGTDVLELKGVTPAQVTETQQSDGSVLVSLTGTQIHVTQISQIDFDDGTETTLTGAPISGTDTSTTTMSVTPGTPTTTGPDPVVLTPSSDAAGTPALSTPTNLSGVSMGVADGTATIISGSGPTASVTTETISGVTQIAFGDGMAVVDPSGNASDVARLYQAVFGRQADASGLQFWANAMDSGSATLSQVEAGFLASSEGTQIATEDAGTFVNQVYENSLNRPADTAGLSFWTNAIATGAATRADVLQAIGESGEAQVDTVAVDGSNAATDVGNLYTAVLGRAPDVAGEQFWTSQVEGGATLQQVAQGMMGSSEFAADNLSTIALVTQLYQNELARAPDASGLAYWTGQISSGAVSAAGAAVGFATSAEAMANTAASSHQGWVWLGTS